MHIEVNVCMYMIYMPGYIQKDDEKVNHNFKMLPCGEENEPCEKTGIETRLLGLFIL